MIPMVDLKTQYELLKEDINKVVNDVLKSSQFIQGPNVNKFEQEIANYFSIESENVFSVASGTDALHLSLLTLNPKPDDEIITTPFSFISSAWPASYANCKLVFVDIDPVTFNMDVTKLEEVITDKTKAIIPVHLFGQVLDVAYIKEIVQGKDIAIIEDCAQAFGAKLNGKQVGTIGDFGCFSFFPSKNLGAYGDGGLILSNNSAKSKTITMLRNHGSSRRYHHDIIGFNSRLDEIQAAVLRIKLKHIDGFNDARKKIAMQYNDEINNPRVTAPSISKNFDHVFHQYTILTNNRDDLQTYLRENGVSSAIYYPIPIHKQNVYKSSHANVALKNAEDVAQKCLSLPIYPELKSDDVSYIANLVNKF
tara:strand:+ start:2686 stop:3780 length:1095 start_codon:yes stop_codon:yes gene_type:complete